MKKNNLINITFLLLIVLWLPFSAIKAQSPNQFKYQAILRDANGNLIANQQKAVVIDILQGSETGASVFTETQNITTTAQGIINLNIGSVNSMGISAIDWASNNYYIKITVGGIQMGTSQLLSVPYALYAKTADYNNLKNKPNVVSPINIPRAGDILYFNGSAWDLLSKGTDGQTLRLDNGKPNWGEPGYALPIVTTVATSDMMTNAATSGGLTIATGFSNITARGVCWATTQNPTTANSKTSDGIGIGTFSSEIKDLQPNTTYYLRAYATNGAGTAYGNQVTFTTFQNVVFPTVTTNAITNITANAVTSGGNVTATGGGEVTGRGVCWSDHQNPTIADSKTTDGNGTGEYQSQISGLIPGTYYARAYATNSAGTGYGNMVTFTTEKTLPVLTTKAITEISAMGAVSGGNISSAGGGSISGRGICWNDSPNPTIVNEKTASTATASSFSAAIAKATPGTTYYLKAYATNEIGTGYGDQKTFTTSDAQYYTSFETGMTPAGWTGLWTTSNSRSFVGSYCLKSLDGVGSSMTFSITTSIPGQISFYYSLDCGQYGCSMSPTSIDFYIDNVKVINLPASSGWSQCMFDLDSGVHSLKWQFNASYGGAGYIDQIIITK